MLELKEEREIVKGVINFIENKYDSIKEITVEQNEKDYIIKIETKEDRSIIDKMKRSSDKLLDKCSLLFHIKGQEVPVNFL